MGLQAIVMAGGEGVRLRPLTERLPKPLAPLLGEPCMGYGLRLLKRHGMKDIGATLWYRPWEIRGAVGNGQRWGVRVRYYEETAPLGTAGSVRMAMDELTDTFVILSGDGLTDCDLTAAIKSHREKGALATLVLKRVGVPLPYGVVVTDKTGKIVRFVEKPGWSRVVSDLVNTGVYILEPEIFQYIPAEGMPDFGKDIFPALVERGLPVYGWETKGYWCDVGDQRAYLRAQGDLLLGKVHLPHPEGVHESARVDASAVLDGPCWVGEHAVIGPGARIIRSYIGPGAHVGAGAVIEDSCLWERASAGSKAYLRGTVLCNGAAVRDGAETADGCALGEGAVLGAEASLWPGVRVWPRLTVVPGTAAHRNVVTNEAAAPQWTAWGATCRDAEDLCALCGGYLRVTGAGRVLCAGEDGADRVLAAGALAAAGGRVIDTGDVTWPMVKTLVRALRLDGGVWTGGGFLRFADRAGKPLTPRQQSAVSGYVLRREAAAAEAGEVRRLSDPEDVYLAALLPVEKPKPLAAPLAVLCESPRLRHLAAEALERAGAVRVRAAAPEETVFTEGETGLALSRDGESLAVFTKAETLPQERTALLLLKLLWESQGRIYDLPGTPRAAEGIGPLLPPDGGEACARQRAVMGDAVAALLLICDGLREKTLEAMLAELPETHVFTRDIPCQTEDKGCILRELCAQAEKSPALGEGARFSHARGCATVTPDNLRDAVRLTAEAADAEFARELCDVYEKRIRQIAGRQGNGETV